MVAGIGSNRYTLSPWLFCKGLLYMIWSILTDLYYWYIVDLYGKYPQERVDNPVYYWG